MPPNRNVLWDLIGPFVDEVQQDSNSSISSHTMLESVPSPPLIYYDSVFHPTSICFFKTFLPTVFSGCWKKNVDQPPNLGIVSGFSPIWVPGNLISPVSQVLSQMHNFGRVPATKVHIYILSHHSPNTSIPCCYLLLSSSTHHAFLRDTFRRTGLDSSVSLQDWAKRTFQ